LAILKGDINTVIGNYMSNKWIGGSRI
jgi:hypothetical protein